MILLLSQLYDPTSTTITPEDEHIECFTNNTKLVGVIQQHIFNIILTNSKNQTLHCQAFNNTNSMAHINYDNSGVEAFIELPFKYYNDRQLDLTFNLADNEALYSTLSQMSILSYTIILGNKLDIPGYFYEIKHTQVNTSNCWSNLTLVYSQIAPKFIMITGNPNDCLITDPTAIFQFEINSTYQKIEILPNTSTDAAYKGFKHPYVHDNTTFYQQFYDNSNASQQKLFDQFFTNFNSNRTLSTRLLLEFGSQQVFGYANFKQTFSASCLLEINPHTVLTRLAVQNVGSLYPLMSCAPGIDLSSKIVIQSVFQGKMSQSEDTLGGLAMKTAIVFYFDEPNDELLIAENVGQQQLFLTIYDDNEVVHEESFYYEIFQSCFFDIKSQVSYKKTCLVYFPTLTDKCFSTYKGGVVSTYQQLLQMNESTLSRVAFQIYESKIEIQNKSYYKVCYDESNVITTTDFPYEPGNYNKRQKSFIKKVKTADKPCIFFSNEKDYQLQYNIAIDQDSAVFLPLFLTIGLVLAVMITVIIVLVIQNNH